MTVQVKVKDQGGVFPGQTHWETGTCNCPFPLENPQLATTLQSKNPSDAPSLPAALPSTQLSDLPMPTPADHRGQEGDTKGQLQGKATLTSGLSLWVLTASMFSETDSTRQPAERSTKTDQQTQQAQDLTKCPIIDPCFSPRGSLDSGGGTSQTPQRV